MSTLTREFDEEFFAMQPPWLQGMNIRQFSIIAAAAAGAAYLIARRNPLVLLAGALTAYGATRMVKHLSTEDTTVVSDRTSVEATVLTEIARGIIVNERPSNVYQLVRSLENAPLLLKFIQRARQVDEGHAIWTARKWLVTKLVDVQLLNDVDGEFVEVSFGHEGQELGKAQIRCTPYKDSGTKVVMVVRHQPVLAGLADSALRPLVAGEINEFLLRLKQLAESGEIAQTFEVST